MNSYAAKPRLAFLFLIFCLFYTIIIARLYHIQIQQHAFYANLAEQQYTETVVIAPPRAPIFDCNGNYLALNKESTAAFVLPKQCTDFDTVLTFVKQNFPQAQE